MQPLTPGALVVVGGGPCALLAAAVLVRSARAPLLLVEPPAQHSRAPQPATLLPPRALAQLADANPEAAAALRACGVPVKQRSLSSAAAADDAGDALCMEWPQLRAALLLQLPPGAHVAGMRLTGLSQSGDGVSARLEGRAGRRSQRQLRCAALLGAGGATCAVRATLLGAQVRAQRPAFWHGSSVCGGMRLGERFFAFDDAGACVGSAVAAASGRVYWRLLGAPPPPRASAASSAAALASLAAAAARWPALAAAIAATPAEALACEPCGMGADEAVTWARGRVMLLGGVTAARARLCNVAAGADARVCIPLQRRRAARRAARWRRRRGRWTMRRALQPLSMHTAATPPPPPQRSQPRRHPARDAAAAVVRFRHAARRSRQHCIRIAMRCSHMRRHRRRRACRRRRAVTPRAGCPAA
jgi:hypothetical protein